MDQTRWHGCRFACGIWIALAFMGVAYCQTTGSQAPAAPEPSAATAAQSSSPEKVVLKVGDISVTRSEIETFIQGLNPRAQSSLARQGRKPLGDQFVMMLTLSEEALNHHLDSAPAFKDLLAIRRQEILAQMAYQEIVRQSVVTPGEISEYFAAHREEFEEIQVLQVVIRKKPEGAKEGAPGLAPEEAKTRAEEIRKALASGEVPEKVAEKYRVPNVVRVDSQPYLVHRRSQAGDNRGFMREDMEKAAFELKPGEVTDVFDLGQELALVKVVSHSAPDLGNFSSKIENTLRQQKVAATMDKLVKNAKVWMDGSYFAGHGQAAPSQVKPGGEVAIPSPPK